ncbi:MAG: DNA-formamidopyrimidine glycosylase family protein, partial [Candidatus Limnocylindria bacterium]
MPELPEIEIVRRTLVPRLEGRRIVDVLVRDGRLREP